MSLPALFVCGALTLPVDTAKIHQLDSVVIERHRVAENVMSSNAVQILDRKSFQKLGIADFADAMHRLPGVNLKDYGGAGGMKTVSVRGFGAQHTGVSYDGIMLSDGQSGQIDLSRYSLTNLKEISLLVGDGNEIFVPARYGSRVAVLNINTLQQPEAHRTTTFRVELKSGSFGYVIPFVSWQHRFSPHFTLSTLFEYLHADNNYPYTIQNGIETVSDRRTNSRMNSGHGEVNFILKTNNRQLSGKLYYYDNDRLLPGIVRYYTNLNRERLHERNALGQLTYQYAVSRLWRLKWNAKVDWAGSSYVDGNYPDGINDARYWQREYYANMCVLWQPLEGLSANYSIDFSHANLNSSKNLYGLPYRNSWLQSLAFRYKQGRLLATARLMHSLYLNGNKRSEPSDDMKRLSPSFSLSYRLLPDELLFVRLSYKNIFRAPTFNESYYAHYGSRNLKPESTNQLNLGFTYDKTIRRSHWTLSLDSYLNHITDKIIAIPYNMFIWQNINMGKVKMLGIDATVRWEWHLSRLHTLNLATNYSYLRAANRTNRQSDNYGKQIAYTPEHSGNMAIGWQNPWINITMNATGVSRTWATNNHYEDTDIKPYTDIGATLYRRFTIWRQSATARLDLQNLFNTQYEIVGHYPMPGRRLMLTLAWDWNR